MSVIANYQTADILICLIDKFVIITVFVRYHDNGHMNIRTKPVIRDPKQPTGMKKMNSALGFVRLFALTLQTKQAGSPHRPSLMNSWQSSTVLVYDISIRVLDL